jgi:hypothetical protein
VGSFRLVVLLAAAAGALASASANAGTCVIGARSVSRICDAYNICVDSGVQSGSPAVSSRSNGLITDSYALTGDAAMTMDVDAFSAHVFAGGYTPMYINASNGIRGAGSGFYDDCLEFGGAAGSGRFHLPIHLTGSRTLIWDADSTWTGTDPLAGAGIDILCFAFPIGGGGATPCAKPNALIFHEDGAIDVTVEVVVPFEFGQSVTFQFDPGVNASVGYAANGDESFMTAQATIDVAGALLPAYVTDEFGTTIPGATVTSSSGFDYLLPEPSEAAVAALGALVLLCRPRARSRL